MDLRSTILGLLDWQPASGYDLKRIISDSEVFYWSGNNNQIYKSLLDMQREGLVTCREQEQENLPAKKIYTISEAGRQELQRSLLQAPQLPENHKNFLIQLAWAEQLSDAQVLELLTKYEGEIAARLIMHQAQAQRASRTPARSVREQYLWRRIGENLVQTYQAELDWVQQTRQGIEALILEKTQIE